MTEAGTNYRQQRAAYVELMSNQIAPNTFLTLATNQTWSIEQVRRSLKAFLATVDRQLLGSAWAKQPVEKRTEGVFVLEHVESNIHAHGLLRLPDARGKDIDFILGRYWGRLCEGGSVARKDLYDARRCAEYCTKEMTSPRFRDEQIVCSWDFLRRQD